jgi:hypothetical protein
MKSRITALFALSALVGVVAWAGCSDDGGGGATPLDAGGGGSGDKCNIGADLEKPPIGGTPAECGATACSSTTKVDGCPANACMSQADQTGPTKNFRMGRIKLWKPDALLSLAGIAVDPNVNAKCANGGTESFTWLIQLDTATKTIKTGGSRGSADSKKFAFLDESVKGAALESICPGFKGPTEEIDLRPVTGTYKENADGSISSPRIERVNVPIFDTSGIPIILPLREAELKDITVKGNCIGGYDKKFWCDGDSLGWTTGGAVVAKMTAEEADRVPVKSAGCQSLCAILVNDSTKTDGKVCKRGPDGKVPEIGTTCLGGTGCKNAFLLSATFGAYGVEITGAAPPPSDAGTDSGSSDAGGSDAGATDAASGD